MKKELEEFKNKLISIESIKIDDLTEKEQEMLSELIIFDFTLLKKIEFETENEKIEEIKYIVKYSIAYKRYLKDAKDNNLSNIYSFNEFCNITYKSNDKKYLKFNYNEIEEIFETIYDLSNETQENNEEQRKILIKEYIDNDEDFFKNDIEIEFSNIEELLKINNINILNTVDNELYIDDDRIINFAFEKGYKIDYLSSEAIRRNSKWFMKAIENGDIDAINYVNDEVISKLDDNIIDFLFEKGYKIDYLSSKAIRSNSKWFIKAIDNGDIDVINYASEEVISKLDDKVIDLLFKKGYKINHSSSKAIKSNLKWIMKAKDNGQIDVVNYITNETIYKIDDETIDKLFKKGYKIDYWSSETIRNDYKWISIAIENGEIDAINYTNDKVILKLDDKVIDLLFKKGYKISRSSSEAIKSNLKWIMKAIDNGQIDVVNYVTNDLIYKIDEENIDKLFKKGYKIDYWSSETIKNNFKWISIAIENGQIHAVDYATNEVISKLDDNIINFIFNKGYKIDYSSSEFIKNNSRWLVKAIENGDINSINYVQEELITKIDDKIIDLLFEKGYKINNLSNKIIKNIPKWYIKAIEHEDIDSINYATNDVINALDKKIIDTIFEKGYKLDNNSSDVVKNNVIILLKALDYNQLKALKYLNKSLLTNKLVINKLEEIIFNTNYTFVSDNLDENGFNIFLLKIVYSKIKDNSKYQEKYKEYLEIIYKNLIKEYTDEEQVKRYIEKVFSNETIDPNNLKNIINIKVLTFVNNYNSDITSIDAAERIAGIPNEILEKANRKQIKTIIQELKKICNSNSNNLELLAINLYLTLDHQRILDLLHGKYGKVTEEILMHMFANINQFTVLFEKDGNGYKPILNERLINLIFGENYKISNTVIKNYLNGFEDAKKEIKEQDKLDKYKDNICEFVKNISQLFNEWDIVEEEFIGSQAISSLKLKLNIQNINELIKAINKKREIYKYNIQDEELANSDLFEYIFNDQKFSVGKNINEQIERSKVLSKRMEDKKIKKFPNIKLTKGKYTIRVYHPQDRRLLSAGYRSNCCFRPCSIADDKGQDYSLMNYCITSEYGGAVEIVDENNKTYMFSPILRNGNVLMIHSLESKFDKLPEECHELLKEFADAMIKISGQNNDDISFVTMTDLHSSRIKMDNIEGQLPSESKFCIYDEHEKYQNMYNNLSQVHLILSAKKGKKIQDIEYGKVYVQYEFKEKSFSYNIVQVDEAELKIINEMLILDKEYIEKVNEWQKSISYIDNKKNYTNENKAYQIYYEMKINRQKYKEKYQQIANKNIGENKYLKYKKALKKIKYINSDDNFDTKNVINIEYGNYWYIAKMKNGKVIVNCLKGKEEELKKVIAKDISTGFYDKYVFYNSSNNLETLKEETNESRKNTR